jgi:phosphohistidine phosphatase
MLLHLLRHAHAGDASAWSGPDEVRPLTDKGRRQSDRLGAHLAGIGFVPDAIISSPKTRALETAEIVAGHLGLAVAIDDRLGGGLDVATTDAVLADHGDPQQPVLVGHDPDFSDLLATLCDAGDVPMRKGALARIEIARPLAAGGGTLRWLLPPDALRPER